MNRSAIVLSHGLHGPWNMGEVVLARNFSKVISELYDNVSVISTIDGRRGKNVSSSERHGSNVIFRRSEEELVCLLKSELRREPSADVHFVNESIANYPEALWRTRGDTYLYQFAYRILRIPSVTVKALGILALAQLCSLKVITTCSVAHENLGKLFRRNYYFVPAPIDVYPAKDLEKGEKDGFLRITYLGHGTYSRLPYFEVLRSLRRLKADGYKTRFEAYISESGYCDYLPFVKGFQNATSKLGVGELVKICVANLTESQKWEVLANSDVLLFPALTNAAVDPPLVVLEAMSLACCVVATPVQSIPTVLGNSRGVTIKLHDLEAEVYDALKKLAESPQRLQEYITNARRWVMSTHSLESTCENMRRIVE